MAEPSRFGLNALFGTESQNAASEQGLPTSEDNQNLFGPSPKTVFGPPQTQHFGSSGVKPVFGSIFGGASSGAQNSSTKPTSVSSQNIFGGAFNRKEDSTSQSGFLSSLRAHNPTADPTRSKVHDETSREVQSTGKVPSFSFSKAIFGRVTSAGSVTSSLANQDVEKHDTSVTSNENESVKQTSEWEPDSQGEETNKPRRSTKIIRKRGVFGRAIEDVAKPSSRSQSTEDLRSIMFHPLDGELPDTAVLKDHFSQYGTPRLTINKERRSGIATYKSHEEALKAKNGGHTIDGVKFKFFWRNMVKSRRRSNDEVDKKSPEDKRKKLRQTEIDPSVMEELEAMSGIEYYIPEESSSKRKLALESDARKKSRSQIKSGISDVGQAQSEEKSDLGRRAEKGRDVRLRLNKVMKEESSEEKPSVRSRTSLADRKSTKKTPNAGEKDVPEETKPERGDIVSSESTIFSSAALSELQETLKQQALSPEDRLRVLEARDKLMRLRQVKQYDISKAVKTVGTCPDMCPEKERLLRETRRQISQYETKPSKPNEMDPSLMVKQYSRSSADQEEPLPHELRPPSVLTMTMNYLMHSIMNLGDQPGENLGEWYHFLWDRLRGIRKEITQQELCDMDAVRLVEQCARFHIHCGARLVAEDMSVFDDRINTENLTKCLQTLKHMYHDLWTNSSIICPNEPEFVTYFLLLNLNNGTIMWEMEQLREEVLESPEIGFVAAMYNSLSSNNFVRFFRLVRKASYLNSCLCIRYFYQVRATALKTYVKALAKIRPLQYPLEALVEELGFENTERAAAFCTHHGLVVENGTPDSASVTLSPHAFGNPGFVMPSERALKLAESKKMGSVGEVVNGGPLPPRSFDGHRVHESFDENGYLRKSALFAKDQGATGTELKEHDEGNVLQDIGKAENRSVQKKTVASTSSAQTTENSDKTVLPLPSASFGGFGNQTHLFPSPFSTSQPFNPPLFNSTTNQIFKTISEPVTVQPSNINQDASNHFTLPKPHLHEPLISSAFQSTPVDPTHAIREAERRAQELEEAINNTSEFAAEEVLQSCIQEGAVEAAQSEWNAAEEYRRAEEQRHTEEQLHAQEELRKRLLDARVDKISSDSVSEIINEVALELVCSVAQEIHKAEELLLQHINEVSCKSLVFLLQTVVQEVCHDMALEEIKQLQKFARQKAIQERVKQIFYLWLKRARCSLQRKRVMEDFPASVIPLSIKEHAERWGFPVDVQANAEEACSKGSVKVLDLPDLRGVSFHPQTAFVELIGAQVVHRYDSVRTKLGLSLTDKLLYKLFVSVPEDLRDPATQIIEWWIHRTLKQNPSMPCDHAQEDVYRLVSGVKVTSEVAVYGSLQMVKGLKPLEERKGLGSGTSAVLFTVSPVSNLHEGKSRLRALMKSVNRLPPLPLVVAVVSASEPPLDGLKQLVHELELDVWLKEKKICDYQILFIKDLFDIKYLSDRLNIAFNYMVMTWTPIPEFTLVSLKNVLKSTFQMFYISIQFNYNRSEVYPQDVDDPRVLIGLCNEWLHHMYQEFSDSYHEARYLCGEEFWSFLHKGAFLPFIKKSNYEQLLNEVMQSVHLPPMAWPPSSEEDFENLISHYCSWLRPEEQKHTLRRLSCQSGLLWPEKMNSIPWINLVEDWMEARINHLETSDTCGMEFLCLMRSPNVEYLYSSPWWAQSKHIISYLETLGSGEHCAMDIDQAVPSESLAEAPMGTPSPLKERFPVKPEKCGGDQLQKVVQCINQLKSENEALSVRLQKALADESCYEAQHQKSVSKMDLLDQGNIKSNLTNSKSLVETIELEVQHQRDYQNNQNHSLSRALDEDNMTNLEIIRKPAIPPELFVDLLSPHASKANFSSSQENEGLLKEINKSCVGKNLNTVSGDNVHNMSQNSSQKMAEIMMSANQIISSLNKKYSILEASSKLERISDLRIGVGNVENSAAASLTEDLCPSSYIEESQRRMQERLEGQLFKRRHGNKQKLQLTSADSDLDVLSDDESTSTVLRTVSSPSSLEDNSNDCDSDFEEQNGAHQRSQHLQSDSEDSNYGRKRHQQYPNDSEDDAPRKKTQSYYSDSEEDTHDRKRCQEYLSGSEENIGQERTQSYHQGSDAESESSRNSDTDSEDQYKTDQKSPLHGSKRGLQNSLRDSRKKDNSKMLAQKWETKCDSNNEEPNDANDLREDHSESGEDEEEDVQTISSGESRDDTANQLDHNSIPDRQNEHIGQYFDCGNSEPDLNYVIRTEECGAKNEIIVSEGDRQENLINLDNVQNDFKYYEHSEGLYGGEVLYSDHPDMDVLHADRVETQTVLLNSEPGTHVLMSQFEQSSDDGHQNVYEVELQADGNKESEGSVLDCSAETVHSNSDEGECSQENTEMLPECQGYGDDILGSQIDLQRSEQDGEESEEEESVLEEEECEDDGEEEECEDEEEFEEECDEEEVESDVESEQDEDSDVCEVIDDDD